MQRLVRRVIVCLVFVLRLTTVFGQPMDSVDYHRADSVAMLYPDFPLDNLNRLAFKLTSSLHTDREKFRAIYRWVCENIASDIDLYRLVIKKHESLKDDEAIRVWNASIHQSVFNTLVSKHRTICSGYAYLIRELAIHAGFNCEIVDGYGRTAVSKIQSGGIPNHSWNAVFLDTTWYLCDATWSSGVFDVNKKTFVKEFESCYFLADADLFSRSHCPLDPKWFLVKTYPTLDEFVSRPLVYVNAFREEIEPAPTERMDVSVLKGEQVSFKLLLKNQSELKNVTLEAVRGMSAIKIDPTVTKQPDSTYVVSYRPFLAGDYVVHLLVNGHYTVTYRVVVRRR